MGVKFMSGNERVVIINVFYDYDTESQCFIATIEACLPGYCEEDSIVPVLYDDIRNKNEDFFFDTLLKTWGSSRCSIEKYRQNTITKFAEDLETLKKVVNTLIDSEIEKLRHVINSNRIKLNSLPNPETRKFVI